MGDTVRISQLCDALYHKKNLICRKNMPRWYADSVKWAEEWVNKDIVVNADSVASKKKLLTMRYILNHLCPSLTHLKVKPSVEEYGTDGYMQRLFDYEYENSQICIVGTDGKTERPGVWYTVEEYEYLMCAIAPLVFPMCYERMNCSLDDISSCPKLKDPLFEAVEFEKLTTGEATSIRNWYYDMYHRLDEYEGAYLTCDPDIHL